MGLSAIIGGHIKEVLGLNKDIYGTRIAICKQCPLCKRSLKYGLVCTTELWYNPKSGDVSEQQLDGYINGCGCRLGAKTRLTNQICPAGKW